MLSLYAVRRVGSAAATLVAASVLIFVAIHLVPGSFEAVFLGPQATSEMRAREAHKLGLDQPLPEQYLHWMLGMVQGDLGTSLSDGLPIRDHLAARAPATIQLAVMAGILSLCIGVPLGIVAGFSGESRFRRGVSRFVGAATMSVPDFVVGSVLIFGFSRLSLGLTVSGYVPLLDDPVANLRAMVLPVFTLAIFGSSLYLRTTRDSVRDVLSQPYIAAAVARGESPFSIIRRHILRNAAIPIVTIAAVNFGYLLGGAVIVETLFSIYGVGHYMLDAISQRDYPVVEAGVMLATTLFVALNMLADIAYAVIDPRVVSGSTGSQ